MELSLQETKNRALESYLDKTNYLTKEKAIEINNIS
jgi:hypothetical protein